MPDQCGQCRKEITRDRLPRLPCGHFYCQDCVESITARNNRTWALPCPACGEQFAIPRSYDHNCSPTPKVQTPFIRDLYPSKVRHVFGIPRPSHGSKIMGIALLKNSLFVVSVRSYVDEYEIGDTAVRNLHRHQVPDLRWPRGVAASERLGVIYIVDWYSMWKGVLWRCHTQGFAATRLDFDVQPFGVSVSETQTGSSSDGKVTVLVTCATPVIGNQRIYVYEDNGRALQLTATLPLPSHFQIPRHSLRLQSGEYVTCYGWTSASQHRVGKLRKLRDGGLQAISAYGTWGGYGEQQLRCPLSLSLDEDGLILVVDYYNHRVQLLTHHLQLVRHLITSHDHNIRYPRHVCFDAARGLLFLGLENGNIDVFKVRQ